ncbi:MAG: hypothetical protein ACOVKJ_00515 [Flavobacterium sp.]|jgi:hypothetical protein
MNRVICALALSFLLISCTTSVNQSSLKNLNGYWEVEKVVFPDGSEKILPPSETHDYYEFKQNKGFRKKVTPLVTGNYLVNDLKDEFVVVQKEGVFSMNYKTFLSKWSEQIKLIDADHLVLESEEHYQYYYKRPQAFSVK